MRRDPHDSDQTQSPAPALLDFDGAAAYLGTTPWHVRRLWKERRLTGAHVGKFVRFRVSDLDAYVEANLVEAVR